jgi:Asp-tRNA(Asn)/Glu-tRNA(Gln) amidotransferase A subunit family amidase
MIYAKSLSYYFKEELKQKNLVSKIFYEFASQAGNISLENFDSAIDYQNMITRKLDKEFEKFDIIISLSTANHAPFRNEPEKDDPSLIWTMCGVPAINVPALKSNDSLPLGVQIVARKYNDKLLLNFVKELHQKNLIKDGPYPKLKL